MSQPSASSSNNSDTESRDHPGLVDSLAQVNQAGQQTLDSATQTLSALRNLLWADLALARAGLRKALLWSAAVVVFATSAWLLLISAITVLLLELNVPLPVALLFSGLVSLMAALMALSWVKFYLRHTDLAATRRQIAALHWPEAAQKSSDVKRDTASVNTAINTANSGQIP